MPHGSLTLQLHVVLVAVNVEARPGSVVDAPNDDCGDLDRVAALVIDLQALAVEVPRAERNLAPRVERIGATKSGEPGRPSVAAEELQDGRFVRLYRVQTGEEEHAESHQCHENEHRADESTDRR